MNNKVKLNTIIGACIFLMIPLYYFTPKKEWKTMEIDMYNYYLSIKFPQGCKITWYNAVSNSGAPAIGSTIIVNEKFNINRIRRQLEEQKWQLKEKSEYKGLKEFKYCKSIYVYSLSEFGKLEWGESVTRSD